VQRRAAPVILDGDDCIIRSETGSGKTLAFLLPLLSRLPYPPLTYPDDLQVTASPSDLQPWCCRSFLSKMPGALCRSHGGPIVCAPLQCCSVPSEAGTRPGTLTLCEVVIVCRALQQLSWSQHGSWACRWHRRCMVLVCACRGPVLPDVGLYLPELSVTGRAASSC
jgi:hypothetical protein